MNLRYSISHRLSSSCSDSDIASTGSESGIHEPPHSGTVEINRLPAIRQHQNIKLWKIYQVGCESVIHIFLPFVVSMFHRHFLWNLL